MALREIDWGRWYGRIGTSVSHLEWAYSPARFLDVLRAHLPGGQATRVLELGCAPGRWLAWVSSRLGAHAIGIDLEAEGTAVSRSLFPKIPVARADAFHLPFASASFDALYAIGLIEHFEDPSGIIREAWRVLRPGGTSIWLVPNLVPGSFPRWHWRTFHRENFEAHRCFTLDELSDAVRSGGFEIRHCEYSGLYVPHFQRVLGRLPIRRLLRRFETAQLATNLVVVGERRREGK